MRLHMYSNVQLIGQELPSPQVICIINIRVYILFYSYNLYITTKIPLNLLPYTSYLTGAIKYSVISS